MSEFECSLKDLNTPNRDKDEPNVQTDEMSNKDNIRVNVSAKKTTSSNESANNETMNNETMNKETVTNFTTDTLIRRIKEEKNIRIILLVVISYLVTHSEQFIEILQNTFPYLIDYGKTNLLGKIVLALIIGLVVVIFTSFFQDH